MPDYTALWQRIQQLGLALGFTQLGVSNIDLADAGIGLQNWLAQGLHGELDYMARNTDLRAAPEKLHPNTLSIISLSYPYLPRLASISASERNAKATLSQAKNLLHQPKLAYLSRYALGRDYHKVLRKKLQTLAKQIEAEIGLFGYRVFTDSAPVLEVEIATRAGNGWRGKHTLLLNRQHGSFFFLGEIFTDLPLIPTNHPVENHCGKCTACIDCCPTQAIIAPYRLDARRCISYLTIELSGSIPEEMRKAIGNRIYGCDDCQLYCPWNRFAQYSDDADFNIRHGLDESSLVALFSWSEADFSQRLAGSPIHRIGYLHWLRNIAVGLGNAPSQPDIIQALQQRAQHDNAMVREHVAWALAQHGIPQPPLK